MAGRIPPLHRNGQSGHTPVANCLEGLNKLLTASAKPPYSITWAGALRRRYALFLFGPWPLFFTKKKNKKEIIISLCKSRRLRQSHDRAPGDCRNSYSVCIILAPLFSICSGSSGWSRISYSRPNYTCRLRVCYLLDRRRSGQRRATSTLPPVADTSVWVSPNRISAPRV